MFVRLMFLALALLTRVPAMAEDAAYARAVGEAIAAQQQGDFERARRLFLEAHALEPNARTLRGMGVTAFQAGDFKQAVTDLSASLEHPQKPLEGELRTAVLALLTEAQAKLALQRDFLLRPAAPATAPRAPAADPTPPPPPAQTLRVVLPASTIAPSPEPLSARGRALRRATLASLTLGGALGASMTALWIAGSLRARDIEQACGVQCSQEFVDGQVARANLRGLERAVNLTAASAVVAFGGSLGIWLWGRREAAERRGRLSVGQKSILYTGSF